MDSTIQSSFIPKQTINPVSSRSTAGSSDTGVGLFTILSFVILFISLVGAGGSFAYKSYLQAKIYSPCKTTSQVDPNTELLGLSGDIESRCGLYSSLEEMRRRLDNERLTKMQRLDTKMKLASVVLSSHSTIDPLFNFLSTSTLKTIRYTRFSMTGGEAKLQGTASGYEDIAVQSNVLNSMPEVENSLFSDLDLDPKGNVAFTLSFRVNPKKILYTANLSQ